MERPEKLKSICDCCWDAADETEQSKLCEKLVNFINDGGDDALADVAQLLLTDYTLEDIVHIFLAICNQVGKVDVLPLIAELVTDPSESDWLHRSHLDTDELMSLSYCESLIATARSNKEHLGYVIEIFYSLSPDDMNMKVLPNLLACVKVYWQDKQLVQETIALSAVALRDYHECLDDRDPVMESELLLSMADLLSLFLTEYPSKIDLNDELDLPKNLDDSAQLSRLLIQAASYSILEAGFSDYPKSLKILRIILPIICHSLDESMNDYMENCSSVHLLVEFLTLASKECNDSTCTKDLKLLIECRAVQKLVAFLEIPSNERICCQEESGDCLPAEHCKFVCGVVIFLCLLKDTNESDLSVEEGNELLNLLRRVLNNEKIFRADGKGIDMMYGDLCLVLILKIIDTRSEECHPFICDPDNKILSTMISFATKHPPCLRILCVPIRRICLDCKAVEFLDQLIVLLPMFLHHRVGKNDDSKSEEINTIPTVTIDILQTVVSLCTLAQIQEMESRFNIMDLMLKVLSSSKSRKMIIAMLDIFNNMIDKHHLSFFYIEYLTKIISTIWKKLKSSPTVKKSVMKLTYKVILLLPSSCENLDYSILVPTVLEDIKNITLFKPQNPGLLRLSWELVKNRQHEQLCKALVQVSSDKTVEYASPGNIDLAKIFKLISDLIIEYLENEPPFGTKYLTDLTQCMIGIARSSSLDEELYVLEDMVSPAMWLLEKQDDEKIVANVKEFIRILH